MEDCDPGEDHRRQDRWDEETEEAYEAMMSLLTKILRGVNGNHHKLAQLQQEVRQMALSQADFDTQLAALVTAITQLDDAVDAFIAAQPAGVDLTAEGQSVADAAAAVAAELAKVQPAPAPEPPA
jgi:chromosome segregation ATPase